MSIYGMCDPRTGMLRYVGGTSRALPVRAAAHVKRIAEYPDRPINRWLSEVAAAGLRPDVFEIEVVPSGEDWEEAERFWIAYFRFVGADLVNITVGGLGLTGYVFPDERKQEMSARFKGRVFTDEWRKRISEARRGKYTPLSPEAETRRIEAVRQACRAKAAAKTHCGHGHELTPENTIVRNGSRACRTCKRIRAAEDYQRTKKVKQQITPEEHARRTREAMQRPDVVAKMRAAKLGKPRAPRGVKAAGVAAQEGTAAR